MPVSFGYLDTTSRAVPELSEEARAFGRDIAFKAGDFELTPAGDYQTVEGLDNLRQALRRRLLTRPGEYRPRPEYGVGAQTYVKKPATGAKRDELRARIIEDFEGDPRVERVLDVAIEDTRIDGRDVIKVVAQVLASGRELGLTTVVNAEEA